MNSKWKSFLILSLFLWCLPSVHAADPAPKKSGDKAAAKDTGKTRIVPSKRQRKALKKAKTFAKLQGLSRKKGKKVPKKPKDPNRLEWGGLPAVNYSTDTGFGVGVIFNLAKFKPGYYPYRWKILGLVYLTLLPNASGDGIGIPYQDHYLKFDFPGLGGGGKLRLSGEGRYSQLNTARYHGIGNNSVSKDIDPNLKVGTDAYKRARQRYLYNHIFPQVQGRLRITLADKWLLFAGATLSYHQMDIYAGSKLEEDKKLADSNSTTDEAKFLRSNLLGLGQHLLLELDAGVVYDSRNDEDTPSGGMFHEISLRGSPGIMENLHFLGINGTFRFYVSLWKQYIVMAIRLIGDVQFGNVPVYRLPAYGGLFPNEGPGGGSTTRGVPWLRYGGKAKVLGNLEFRFKVFSFMNGKLNLGFIAFADAGRVWSDFGAPASFDADEVNGVAQGTGALKYGLGGGIRFQWGKTFIIRLDLAHSPDGFGFYLNVNHIF
jgi:hypothetical protein